MLTLKPNAHNLCLPVFGSKSECFKCGTPKGGGAKSGGGGGKGGGGGSGGGAPAKVVDSVSINIKDRALIRDLMDEMIAPSAGSGAGPGAGTGSNPAPASAASAASAPTPASSGGGGGGGGKGGGGNLKASLSAMGFAEVDLARAEEVCGGLYTMEGSLNWLLLHVPEERIPKDLGQLPKTLPHRHLVK